MIQRACWTSEKAGCTRGTRGEEVCSCLTSLCNLSGQSASLKNSNISHSAERLCLVLVILRSCLYFFWMSMNVFLCREQFRPPEDWSVSCLAECVNNKNALKNLYTIFYLCFRHQLFCHSTDHHLTTDGGSTSYTRGFRLKKRNFWHEKVLIN